MAERHWSDSALARVMAAQVCLFKLHNPDRALSYLEDAIVTQVNNKITCNYIMQFTCIS